MQTYMRELQQQRILSQDTVHYLFGNLNALVDFQRRFLIQMEKTAENQPQDQHFGLLFSQMEDAFSVYEPYCSNFYSAQDLVVQEAPKLQKLNIMNPTHQLTSLLIKPIQRICKYPLLLNELIKSTNKDWLTVPEMATGLDTMRRVADKVNETQRKHENLQMVVELKRRVDDWKGISIDKCGQLLLQDKMVVTAYDNEREMHVFFFENRLLLCKENKDNTKNRLTKANTITMKKRRRGTLEPKGKIETSRIVSLQNVSSNGKLPSQLIDEW
jgi:cell division control protein 24